MSKYRKLAISSLLLITIVFVVSACSDDKKTNDSKSMKTDSTATSKTTEGSSGDSTAVEIKLFAFNPNPVEVKVGSEITWTNQDNINHTVTSGLRDKPDDKFDGLLNEKGSTYTEKFTEAGKYTYFCKIHPGMDAEIDVK